MRFMIAFLFALTSTSIFALPSQQVIEKAKKSVVSIRGASSVFAYSQPGIFSGTGCIVDTENGILVTNAHVAGEDLVINTYEVTLHNGRELKARLLYKDPVHDIAFLKIIQLDNQTKKTLVAVELSERPVQINESVVLIGQNEGKHFSIHTGSIAQKYEAPRFLSDQAFRTNLNVQGGSSGSPVFDEGGKMVGIHFGGDRTFSFAHPATYIINLLKVLKHNKRPARFSLGLVLHYVPLDRLSRFYGFPQKDADHYRKRFSDSFDQALQVESIIPGSPAQGHVQIGDVLTHINGKEIGPRLAFYDQEIDWLAGQNPGKPIPITVIRKGKSVNLSIVPYDLSKRNLTRFVAFGGAIFYEPNDMVRLQTGVGDNAVIANVTNAGSCFSKFPLFPNKGQTGLMCLVRIKKMGDQVIRNLDDLVAAIKTLKEDFVVTFENRAFEAGYSQTLVFNQKEQKIEITYQENDSPPMIYAYSPEKMYWDATPIPRASSLEPMGMTPIQTALVPR